MWRFQWPNSADFNFNYYKLLESGIGRKDVNSSQHSRTRVAIVGAGIAGLVAARELFRSGYRNIEIFEASDRIGGRLYSEPIPGQRHTVYELGAMRLPFFSSPGSNNCVLDYYASHFHIATDSFPNPGGDKIRTGIYFNAGFGPEGPLPNQESRMVIWDGKLDGLPEPYRSVNKKWKSFQQKFDRIAREFYNAPSHKWERFWQSIATRYWAMDFRDLVRLPTVNNPLQHEIGDFGGVGMSEDEANLFSVVGAGDGGWGAFYDIDSLYIIRTLLCGYGRNLQMIIGKRFPNGDVGKPADGNHEPLEKPRFLGVQALAECLYFDPVSADDGSLQSAPTVMFHPEVEVCHCEYRSNGASDKPTILVRWKNKSGADSTGNFDACILTPASWALQEAISSHGFDTLPLPIRMASVRHALNNSHWISSCKVFFPLKQRFWEATANDRCDQIPQVMVTDTFVRDIYGYASGGDAGAVLISYTWEDDADKLVGEAHDAGGTRLAARCLEQVDRMLSQCVNIRRKMSDYIADPTRAKVFHWRLQRNYRGCAKLYRARSWDDDYSLLAFNQESSARSGLYFAGEGFSVEGGWTEPAMRSALDAVIHLIHNTNGCFASGFQFEDYPRYSKWSPDPSSAYLLDP